MPRSITTALTFHARTGLVQRLSVFLTKAVTRRRERQLLARLDSHLLRDIGLSPEDARTECAKPFWQA